MTMAFLNLVTFGLARAVDCRHGATTGLTWRSSDCAACGWNRHQPWRWFG